MRYGSSIGAAGRPSQSIWCRGRGQIWQFLLAGLAIFSILLFTFRPISPTQPPLGNKAANLVCADKIKEIKELKKQSESLHSQIRRLANELEQLKAEFVGRDQRQPVPSRSSSSSPDVLPPSVESSVSTVIPSTPRRSAVLLFTFNRERELRLTIESLLSIKPADIPLFVSQDENHVGVTNVLRQFGSSLTHLHGFRWQGLPPQAIPGMNVYYKIARHFHYGLTEVFNHADRFDNVILIEDDMNFAPDFFDYFQAMSTILHSDPTLYCVSAWNDNGQGERQTPQGRQVSHVSDPKQFYRSDVFPGLGWMMTRQLWEELGGDRWAVGFWDDWLREPEQRKGRSCIYPEINRVASFGKEGSSGGQMYDRYIAPIRLNNERVLFSQLDLHYLYQSSYNEWLRGLVTSARELSSMFELQNVCSQATSPTTVRLTWHQLADLTPMLDSRSLITDHKAGIPRASYAGVIPFRENNCRVLLVQQQYLQSL